MEEDQARLIPGHPLSIQVVLPVEAILHRLAAVVGPLIPLQLQPEAAAHIQPLPLVAAAAHTAAAVHHPQVEEAAHPVGAVEEDNRRIWHSQIKI